MLNNCVYLNLWYQDIDKWAPTRENLSSGLQTMSDSEQPAQQQRLLARMLKWCDITNSYVKTNLLFSFGDIWWLIRDILMISDLAALMLKKK